MWLAENWGNIASVLGLAISVWAWMKARTVERALVRYKRSSQLLEILLSVDRAFHIAQRLQNASRRRFSQSDCDDLCNSLSQLQNAAESGGDDRRAIRKSIAEFREPPENTTRARAEIRDLMDHLDSIRVRLRKDVENQF